MWEVAVPGTGNNKCKGTEARKHIAWCRKCRPVVARVLNERENEKT